MEISVKKAVFTLLDAALSVPVCNGADLNTALPYVDIDEIQEYDWSTDTFTGSRTELRIHVWHSDRDTCATIMETIRTTLDRADLTLDGENYVDCQFRASRSFTDADGTTRHGMVDYEILSHYSE